MKMQNTSTNNMMNKSIKFKRKIFVLASIVAWPLLWHLVSLKLDNPLLLPSPIEVAKRIAVLFGTVDFWRISAMSLLRITEGFLCGVVLGVSLAILSYKINCVRYFTSPVISVLRATPVASFIILVWSFTGSDTLPTFISAIMVLPVIYINLLAGFDSIGDELKEVARVFDFSLAKKAKALYIPETLPYLASAVNTSLGLAWKSGIAAEVLSYTALSIGRELYRAKSMLEVVDLFAWTIWIIVISMSLEYLAKKLIKPLSRRKSNVADYT